MSESARQPRASGVLAGPRSRRDEIVDAAFRCVANKGIAGLRMRDVAAEAGLNIATVHYHVETKTQLIRLVVTRAHERFTARATPPPGHTATSAIRAHLNAAFGVLEEDPQLACVLAEVGVEAAHDASVAEIVAEAEERWRTALQRILVDLPAHRRRQVSALIMLALKGACLQPADAVATRDARRGLFVLIGGMTSQAAGGTTR